MQSPLVTVFMPVYNCAPYLKESLESILNQTYQNLEILMVDDGSTDNSVDIIKQYNDPRIRLLSNGENKGIPYTRSIGMREAKGKYMAIMDSDDISEIKRIEVQVDYLEKNENVLAVGSYYQRFGGRLKRMVKGMPTNEGIKIGLLFANQIGNPSSMVRLEKTRELGISYNQDFFVAQDYDFWVQLSKKGDLFIIPEVLLHYRTSHNNITKKSKTSKYLERRKVIDRIHNDLLDFYDFSLTEADKEMFNTFFDDNPQQAFTEEQIKAVHNMLTKMIQSNKERKIFDQNVFKNILFQYVQGRISAQPVSTTKKIQMINYLSAGLFEESKLKQISYHVLRDVFRKLN